MLVLKRKKDEVVIITVPPSDKETTIEVVVNKLRASANPACWIGFQASRDVVIVREEIWDGQ